MINFARSSFTWKSYPQEADLHYKWMGGFVGEKGDAYHVRFALEASCVVKEEKSGTVSEFFLGAPCRSEYTIAHRNLFQIPNGEWRMAFSHRNVLAIASRPSLESEPAEVGSLKERFDDFWIDIRKYDRVKELKNAAEVAKATLNNDILSVRSSYLERGFRVSVEYPVNLMNLNVDGAQFQVCTGPVLLPDLKTWNGLEVERVFVAHVAISDFGFVEFILRREVEAAPEERNWLDQSRGRDRFELINLDNLPEGYPPPRPKPLVYNETWDRVSENTILMAEE